MLLYFIMPRREIHDLKNVLKLFINYMFMNICSWTVREHTLYWFKNLSRTLMNSPGDVHKIFMNMKIHTNFNEFMQE